MRNLIALLLVGSLLAGNDNCHAAERVLDKKLHHLRIDGEREWSEFPEEAEASELVIRFSGMKNTTEYALRLRQQDVKQTWKITLNGKEIGRLHRNENDMVVYWPIPADTLIDGENSLIIRQSGRTADDVRVGEIRMSESPVDAILNQHSVNVFVHERHGNTLSKDSLPCRITVIDENGALHQVGADSDATMAVRPGVIYCNGRAKFGLPPGNFTVYCGRGFEYGIESVKVELPPSKKKPRSVVIRTSISREVETPGLVSCDTHVHTFTYSRHGDSTIEERMLTLAGENIELPIATDHNVHIDYEQIARRMKLRRYFTPVIGNEVTTKIGHFNVFPIQAGAAIPDYKLTDWKDIFRSIHATPNVKVVILNHGRDIHGGYRPFDPKHHISITGENLDGWELKANAMELVNSGATQTDVMQLYGDWFGLLNRGLSITPVGSSDSHDVARHFVGQARTYIRCDDSDPGNIDVAAAVDSFVNGRVMVSYGLLAEIVVNEKFGPGDLVKISDAVDVSVRVLGPSWTTAERVELYANGQLIREAKIADGQKGGIKWSGKWKLNDLQHDVHLVAIAHGPGVKKLYWPTAKAYQPTSPRWESYVIGSTGAVWLDVDGDGKKTSAVNYATRLLKESSGDVKKLIQLLSGYDTAVAAQAASLLNSQGVRLTESEFRKQLRFAAKPVQNGFNMFIKEWRDSQIARSK